MGLFVAVVVIVVTATVLSGDEVTAHREKDTITIPLNGGALKEENRQSVNHSTQCDKHTHSA